jgi:hypothetical protein
MITFNLQSHNGKYYRGHEPSNLGNCWNDKEENALVLPIEWAKMIAEAWPWHTKIVISVKSDPISYDQFKRELFCAKGGNWYDYKE